MNTQGYFIVFGPLLVIIALIVGGSYYGGNWGRAAIALGVVGGLIWACLGLYMLNAMNTDI